LFVLFSFFVVVYLDRNFRRAAIDDMRITQPVVVQETAAAVLWLEQPDAGTAELPHPPAQVQRRRGGR